MALVPFSYASPFTDQLQLAERLFTIDGRLLKIRQAWKGDGKGGTDIGFGASVYPAAYVLAEYLERHPHLVRGKRVIELGTGTGFLGIATSILGAAQVCLTDGDEQSLQLTQENVDANLGPSSDQQSPHTSPGGDQQQPHNGADNSDSSKSAGASHASDGGCSGRRNTADRTPTISVKKLRWGCEDDMRDVGRCSRGDGDGGSCLPWDVVLGSDIAALPYSSAYGDLLRTIVSLVNSGRGGGEGESAASSLPRNVGDATEEAVNRDAAREGTEDVEERRRVLVLLAHKRRHVSEEAFFEDLAERLGGERSAREMGEGDIHTDFRGKGIRLHMFEIYIYGDTTAELQSAEEVDIGLAPEAQPDPCPLDSGDHQHRPTLATPMQGAIALSTESVDDRLGHLLDKEEREYGSLRNGFHMLRTHYPKRLEGFTTAMTSIAAGVGTGRNISFSDPRPMAEDVVILAFILLGRYLAALADEGGLNNENDDILPAVFFVSASKMVGAGAETTAREVLAAGNVCNPEHAAPLQKRMNALEFEVGSKLGWMLNAATPTEFIHLFLSRAESTGVLEQSCSAGERAMTMAFEWTTRGLLADFKPSELASAAVYRAVLCEGDPATARTVTEVDGSGIPDLLENRRFSALLRQTERHTRQLYSLGSTMAPIASSTGLNIGPLIDADYDTEELTPPSTAGWTGTRNVSFFQDDQVSSNDNTISYYFQPDSGSDDDYNIRPTDWDFVFHQESSRRRTGDPEGTGGRSDGTSAAMLDAKASVAPIGQGALEEESTPPPLTDGETTREWFGSSLFLPSAMTGLAARIEDAAAASGAVDGVHRPVTPSTRSVGRNPASETGQKNVKGGDELFFRWVGGYLLSVAQEKPAEPGVQAGKGPRPVEPNDGTVYNLIDDDDARGVNVGDGAIFAQASAEGTTSHSDIDNRPTKDASQESNRSLLQHGQLLVPSAVVIGRSSREVRCQGDPGPRQSDTEALWERAASRRLHEGIEAYRRQRQESSLTRWGPGGMLVPVA
eukprot:g16032.t1